MAGDDFEIPAGYSLFAPDPGFESEFGPFYLRRENGAATMAFRVLPRHTNIQGFCHGGVVSTFADMQLLSSPAYRRGSEFHTPTISLSVDYIGGAPCGSWVEMDVIELKRTRRLIFTQAVLRVGKDIIARANAIYRAGSAPTQGEKS